MSLAWLGSAAQGLNQGLDTGYKMYDTFKQRQANAGYGDVLKNLMLSSSAPPSGQPGQINSPYPQSPNPGQPPQDYGNSSTPPGSPVQQGSNVVPFPQPKPPAPTGMPNMQVPGATPMPQGVMTQGQPPGGGPQGSPPSPPQGGGMNGGQFQGFDLKHIVDALKQTHPGMSPEAFGMAIDKFLPMMNLQSQMQWHQLQSQMMGQRVNQGQERINETHDYHSATNDYRQQRLGDFQQSLDQRTRRLDQLDRSFSASSNKLDAGTKANLDYLRNKWTQAQQNYRAAQASLTRLQSGMNPDPQALEQAQTALSDAQGRAGYTADQYEEFLSNVPSATRAPANGTQPKPGVGAQGPSQPSIGTGPNGQPLYPVKPAFAKPVSQNGPAPIEGGDWSGQGSGGYVPVNQRPPAMRASETDDIRSQDVASSANRAARPAPWKPGPGALARQTPLIDTPSDTLQAAGKRNVDVKDQGAAQTIEAPRRALRDSGARQNAEGYNQTNGLYEENSHRNDDEMKSWVTQLAKRMGIIPDDWENSSDAIAPPKSKRVPPRPMNSAGPRNV